MKREHLHSTSTSLLKHEGLPTTTGFIGVKPTPTSGTVLVGLCPLMLLAGCWYFEFRADFESIGLGVSYLLVESLTFDWNL